MLGSQSLWTHTSHDWHSRALWSSWTGDWHTGQVQFSWSLLESSSDESGLGGWFLRARALEAFRRPAFLRGGVSVGYDFLPLLPVSVGFGASMGLPGEARRGVLWVFRKAFS